MKKIVCIALAACFVVALVSFSSSVSVENVVTELSVSQVLFEFSSEYRPQFGYSSAFSQSGNSFFFDTSYSFSSPVPLFSRLMIFSNTQYTVPSYSGRPLSLSINLDFVVSDHGYLSLIPSSADISNSAIFTDCFVRLIFSDGSTRNFGLDTFLLIDDNSGHVLDPRSDDYWDSIKGGTPWNFSIYALFDVSSILGLTVEGMYIFFPSSASPIYYDNTALNSYLTLSDLSLNVDFAYSPFQDVVQDDLTDIKTQLGTIDQDVNRVNQSVTDLKDTIEDFQQDLTSSDSSISSDISDKQDIIDSIQDAMQNDNALLDDNLNDMITGFPGAQDPFHDAPSPDNFFAVDFIQQLWSFIKAQTVFFDFIFLGLCFCLATFILRR